MLNFEDVKSGDILYLMTPEKNILELKVNYSKFQYHKEFTDRIHGIDIFVNKEGDEINSYRIFIHHSYFDKNVKFIQLINIKEDTLENVTGLPYLLISTSKNDLIDYQIARLKDNIQYQQKLINDALMAIETLQNEEVKLLEMKNITE